MRQKMLLMVVMLLAACGPQADAALPKAEVRLKAVDGRELVVAVEVAGDDAARAKGLMFRKQMGEMEGMLFVWPEPARRVFWMKNTLLPLDMLFIADGKVVGVIPWAKPMDESPLDPGVDADMVLEVNGGWAAKVGVGIGAEIRVAARP